MSESNHSELHGPAQHDALSAQLAAMPVRDVDESRAADLFAAARREFEREHQRATTSWTDRVGRLYHRALEPALVTAFCASYLAWAFNVVIAVYR